MSDILVVDDDPAVGELLGMYLSREGFTVTSVGSGEECLAQLARHQPALVLLDIMLPGLDGHEVCRVIRARYGVPIIFLTARGEDVDRIVGLEIGADDYVCKPFNPRELVARVKAVLRRVSPSPHQAHQAISAGDLRLDADRRDVCVGSSLIQLTTKEFDILWLLASRPHVCFPRQQIMQHVWGVDEDYSDYRTIDTHVKHLRRKLAAGGATCRLETVWGIGYKFVPSGSGQASSATAPER